jgi:hypothetical protein
MVSSPKVPMAASEGHALVASFRGTSRRLATTNVSPGRGTLQAAVTAATAGDTLVLADGTYTEANSMVCAVDKGITIRAANHLKAIIDGENAKAVFSITGGAVTLDGLTITRGRIDAQGMTVCAFPKI